MDAASFVSPIIVAFHAMFEAQTPHRIHEEWTCYNANEAWAIGSLAHPGKNDFVRYVTDAASACELMFDDKAVRVFCRNAAVIFEESLRIEDNPPISKLEQQSLIWIRQLIITSRMRVSEAELSRQYRHAKKAIMDYAAAHDRILQEEIDAIEALERAKRERDSVRVISDDDEMPDLTPREDEPGIDEGFLGNAGEKTTEMCTRSRSAYVLTGFRSRKKISLNMNGSLARMATMKSKMEKKIPMMQFDESDCPPSAMTTARPSARPATTTAVECMARDKETFASFGDEIKALLERHLKCGISGHGIRDRVVRVFARWRREQSQIVKPVVLKEFNVICNDIEQTLSSDILVPGRVKKLYTTFAKAQRLTTP